MIKCVIFDMDGTLIDSEPFWRIAEREAFAKVGVHLNDDQLAATMGMRHDEVVKYWHHRYRWQDTPLEQVEIDILAKVQELIEKKGQAMPGVDYILEFFKQKQIPIALASSSPLGIIQSVLDTLGIERKFKVTCSAEYEEYGKPHPAVFLATATYMRVNPEECLVFEDSPNGVLAAKSAKMKCVAVPDPDNFNNRFFEIADLKIGSLNDFDESTLEKLMKL
jgi:mannitol-1-/sugar-/sorbitol-6-/2-deoxyglucose-6-phosphatase